MQGLGVDVIVICGGKAAKAAGLNLFVDQVIDGRLSAVSDPDGITLSDALINVTRTLLVYHYGGSAVNHDSQAYDSGGLRIGDALEHSAASAGAVVLNPEVVAVDQAIGIAVDDADTRGIRACLGIRRSIQLDRLCQASEHFLRR